MNFFETRMGHDFFNKQLPRLIGALEIIADTISSTKPGIPFGVVPDGDFLHNLYYGDYDPERYQPLEGQKILNQQVSQAEIALRKQLTPQAEKLLDEYQLAVSIRNDMIAEHSYESGFRTAVQMFLAGSILPRTGGEQSESR